jgi:hypothetical protein
VFVQTLKALEFDNPKIVTTNPVYNQIGEYSMEAEVPKTVPGGGAIRIKVPTTYGRMDATCKNDFIAGSKLDNIGFSCNRVGTTNVFVIILGGSL